MLTHDQAADVFARICKLATADEVECLFYGGHSALTRFANNTIHQNVAEENFGVSVRTAFGGRTARATTNAFDDESLRRVVEASESLARVQQEDSDLLALPGSDMSVRPTQAVPSRYFEQTAGLTPAERADAVGKIVATRAEAEAHDRGDFCQFGNDRRHFQFAWVERLAYSDVGGNFHHHAGSRFLGMAESEFARM